MKIVKSAPFERYHFGDEHLSFIDKLFIKPKHERLAFNQRMFDEDFASIFRSSLLQSSDLFSIKSNNDALAQRLFENIKTRYRSHRIDETVCQLVEEIAQSLTCSGTAYYFLHDSSEGKEIHITSFNAIGVFRFSKAYFQWVPKRRKRYWDSTDEILPRELRILDMTKLIRFNMPKSIRRILSEQNRILAIIDKHQFDRTGFHPRATHENPNPKNYFDFRIWKDTQERALYRATRGTGWNARDYSQSKCSDFFIYHRLIRFRRNQLILRDHILYQLSNELTRVGRQYNAEFHVVVLPTNVLPKVDELDDLEAQLSREEVSFTEVLHLCFRR